MKAKDPVIGIWDLDLANSKFINPPTPFTYRSATRTITEGPEEGTITGWVDAVLPDGSPFREGMDVSRPDGKFRPHGGNPLIDTMASERIDVNTTAYSAKKGDKVVGGGTRSILNDGKVLQMVFIYLDAEGVMRGHVTRYNKRES